MNNKFDCFIFDPEKSDFVLIRLPNLDFVFATTFHDNPWWQGARVVNSRSPIMNFGPRSVKSRWMILFCVCVLE